MPREVGLYLFWYFDQDDERTFWALWRRSGHFVCGGFVV